MPRRDTARKPRPLSSRPKDRWSSRSSEVTTGNGAFSIWERTAEQIALFDRAEANTIR